MLAAADGVADREQGELSGEDAAQGSMGLSFSYATGTPSPAPIHVTTVLFLRGSSWLHASPAMSSASAP